MAKNEMSLRHREPFILKQEGLVHPASKKRNLRKNMMKHTAFINSFLSFKSIEFICKFFFSFLVFSVIVLSHISYAESSSTEAGALCIDGALCAGGGSSSVSRLVGSIPEDSCPKFIIKQQILRDEKGSLTTESPDEICSTGIANNLNHFKNAGEFESYLQSHPFFSELNKKKVLPPPVFLHASLKVFPFLWVF